jgi:enterochelin esterase-like enzyme
VDDGSLPLLGTGAAFAAREPTTLAATVPDLDPLDIWIDTGEEDPWLPRVRDLVAVLEERDLNVQFSILPGGHEGAYWQANIPTYLRFYDRALNRRS